MDPNSITQASDSLNEKLRELSGAQSECTIYRVHAQLRNVNPKAYDPEVIAIGPYHRDKDHLKMMEHHKLRYLQLLLTEKHPPDNVERYVAALGRMEAEARKCYADQPKSLTPEFIEMLVLDGCFIVQLVRKFDRVLLREKNDTIFQMSWMINSLQRDLMLFENQLPFFVLCELYDLIEVPGQHTRFWHLLFNFFGRGSLYPGQGYKEKATVAPRQVKHLLDFIHRSWLPPWGSGGREVNKRDKRLRFINNATRLKEANVKFKRSEQATTLFDVGFKDGVMIMAPLTIEDRTESFLRNLTAYEQYFQQNFVTDYVKFLDCIVDSSKDVEILSRSGIVENWLGDEHKVAEMVNKLSDSVAGPGNCFIYADMFEDVNKHCRKHRNRWMAKLRRNYFNSPWAIISVLVAVVLLLLTVTQTLFTILQVV